MILGQEEADRNPSKDRSPEGKLVLTRLCLVLFGGPSAQQGPLFVNMKG